MELHYNGRCPAWCFCFLSGTKLSLPFARADLVWWARVPHASTLLHMISTPVCYTRKPGRYTRFLHDSFWFFAGFAAHRLPSRRLTDAHSDLPDTASRVQTCSRASSLGLAEKFANVCPPTNPILLRCVATPQFKSASALPTTAEHDRLRSPSP